METLDLEDFIAGPLDPSVPLEISPGVTIEVRQEKLESDRDRLAEFAQKIPGIDNGLSWVQLMPFTNQNGTHAKLFIALGDFLGLWSRHPKILAPQMWNPRLHPMVLSGSLAVGSPSTRVPKPSRGDLEIQVSACEVCNAEISDISAVELDPRFEVCSDCGLAKKSDEPERTRPPHPTGGQREKRAEEVREEPGVPSFVRDYLKQFQD